MAASKGDQTTYTAQKMKFSIMDFFNKCDQIHGKLPIYLHLLKKSLTENFVFLCSKVMFRKVTHQILKGISWNITAKNWLIFYNFLVIILQEMQQLQRFMWRGHPFSTCPKFCKKLTCYHGVRIFIFSENFSYVINEWFPIVGNSPNHYVLQMLLTWKL